jgi:peptidoglycan/xylan/chitin deacetylase (PgdA/CDA1 family)
MLNYRTANIYLLIFAAVALLLMIINIQYWWLLAILAILYICLLVMGSVKICGSFYIDVICKGVTEEKVVALTFDDGPDPKNTPVILDILAKHQVTATFFIIGNKAENQEELLHHIFSKGHTLGNHSYSHAFLFDLFGRKKMERDLQRADEIIMKVCGKKPVYFRPPYGVTNPVLAKTVKKLGYKVIGWSIRSLDTVLKDEEKITERIKDRLHPGAVILMHDDREVTAKVIEKVILMVKEEGYRFVGMEKLIIANS